VMVDVFAYLLRGGPRSREPRFQTAPSCPECEGRAVAMLVAAD